MASHKEIVDPLRRLAVTPIIDETTLEVAAPMCHHPYMSIPTPSMHKKQMEPSSVDKESVPVTTLEAARPTINNKITETNMSTTILSATAMSVDENVLSIAATLKEAQDELNVAVSRLERAKPPYLGVPTKKGKRKSPSISGTISSATSRSA